MTITPAAAKQDCARRMAANGVTYEKLTATSDTSWVTGNKTVFVNILGWAGDTPKDTVFADMPRAEAGGYIPHIRTRANMKPGQVIVQG